MRHAQPSGCLARRNVTALPDRFYGVIFGRAVYGFSAKADATFLRRRDAFRLPLPDILALVVRHEAENLQDQV